MRGKCYRKYEIDKEGENIYTQYVWSRIGREKGEKNRKWDLKMAICLSKYACSSFEFEFIVAWW